MIFRQLNTVTQGRFLIWEMASFYAETIENKGFRSLIVERSREKRDSDRSVDYSDFSKKSHF